MHSKKTLLFLTRPNIFTTPGGDTIQVRHRIAELEKYGWVVEINPSIIDYNKYAVAHLFNFSYELHFLINCYRQFTSVKGKLPVVLEPIYWEWKWSDLVKVYGEFMGLFSTAQFKGEGLISRNYDSFKRTPLKYLLRNELRRKIITGIDYLLPNSQAEDVYIKNRFKVKCRSAVVYNGVEPVGVVNKELFSERYKVKDYILCVGTVYPRKNQHRMLMAIKNMKHPVVLIGPAVAEYLKACRAACPKLIYIPRTDDRELINSAYAGAALHILPSFYETPGLSSLEAAMAGCKVVSTNIGSAKEYFGDYAWYCEPTVKSISTAVQEALSGELKPGLPIKLLKEFSWQQPAEITNGIYKELAS